jgi:hypothetical protein
MQRLVRALMLVVPLYAASVVVFPNTVSVAEAAKAKKAKKKKAKKETLAVPEVGADGLPSGDAPASAAKPRKVTAAAIVKWSKKGESEAEILARAEAAGYTASKKDLRLFKKKKLSAELIEGLGGTAVAAAPKASARAAEDEAPAPAARPSKAEPKVDLTKPARVSDIDFDDVAPPEGSPGWVADKQKKDAAAASPASAKVDRSARPAAPFEEPAAAPAPASGAPRTRKPILPADS